MAVNQYEPNTSPRRDQPVQVPKDKPSKPSAHQKKEDLKEKPVEKNPGDQFTG
jgi:hypothetical protein